MLAEKEWNVYKKFCKVLKLDVEESEDLLHDIKNLRAGEWLSAPNTDKEVEVYTEFYTTFVSPKEDFEEGWKGWDDVYDQYRDAIRRSEIYTDTFHFWDWTVERSALLVLKQEVSENVTEEEMKHLWQKCKEAAKEKSEKENMPEEERKDREAELATDFIIEILDADATTDILDTLKELFVEIDAELAEIIAKIAET